VLDDVGLPDLSMRRLGTELGVQPSALYHHVPNKQTLLALMADALLASVPWPDEASWEDQVAGVCAVLREVLLSCRDGAELVATVWAFGLGGAHPHLLLVKALDGGGFGPLADVAARTLLHFVYGHVSAEQTHLQAAEAGAIEAEVAAPEEFGTGLGIVIAGIQVVHASRR
jgi:AcrR family transcriptional regulator